jgi:Met-10+ like-protein
VHAVRLCITEMRILCMAAEQGPSVLSCMPSRTRLYPIGFSDGVTWGVWGSQVGSIENEFRVFEMEVLAGEPVLETVLSQHRAKFKLDFSKACPPSRPRLKPHRAGRRGPLWSLQIRIFETLCCPRRAATEHPVPRASGVLELPARAGTSSPRQHL